VTLTIEIPNWFVTLASKYEKTLELPKNSIMVEHKALKCNITNCVIQVVNGDHWPHPPYDHYANVFSSKPKKRKKIQMANMTYDTPWH
jgi:hypothetical protein